MPTENSLVLSDAEGLTEKALKGMKEYISRALAFGAYQLDGGELVKVPIQRKEWLKDGRLAVYVSIAPESQDDTTVSLVQLYDTDSELWLNKKSNISIRSVQEGALYRFIFDVQEILIDQTEEKEE